MSNNRSRFLNTPLIPGMAITAPRRSLKKLENSCSSKIFKSKEKSRLSKTS